MEVGRLEYETRILGRLEIREEGEDEEELGEVVDLEMRVWDEYSCKLWVAI